MNKCKSNDQSKIVGMTIGMLYEYVRLRFGYVDDIVIHIAKRSDDFKKHLEAAEAEDNA